jgi:hypothetical protein
MKITIFQNTKPVVRWKSTDVSQEYIVSFFMVEELSAKETSMETDSSAFNLHSS